MLPWLPLTLAILLIIVMITFIAWASSQILDDMLKLKSINEFSKDLKDSIKHSQPSWDEIKEIASTRGLTQAQIQPTIKKYYREIITGRDEELGQHKEIISGYIEKYRKDEPFEGLPSEVRIHLERIRDQINGNEHLLSPLTSQIKDLATANESDRKTQRYYTTGGFFVGLAGLLIAIYTITPGNIFHNAGQENPTKTEHTEAQSKKQIQTHDLEPPSEPR